ncbi:MAG TPA: recombinase family protein [Candidatus Dojkabacteria bacterium]|nr:recombinase family protein [Candidatus Dojkabacteria bacterium]
MQNRFDQENVKRVALYIRVSTDEQVEKFGIPMQKETLLNLIKAKGKTIEGKDRYVYAGGMDEKGNVIDDQYIYIDEGASGTLPMDERVAFRRMISDIDNTEGLQKPFDVVAVYKIDRFARRLKVLLEIIDYFDEKDIEFISANESIDTTNPFGKAVLGIIGVIAELELENIMERTHTGKASASKEGVFMGSHAPYGYKKDLDKKLVILEEEANYIRQIFNMYLWENSSRQAIADWLMQHKVPSPSVSAEMHEKYRGKRRKVNKPYFWDSNVIKHILRNKIYMGEYWYSKKKGKDKERVLSEHIHDAIIDKPTFVAVQEKLLKDEITRRDQGMHSDSIYLLRGLLRCANCYNPEIDMQPHNWVGERKLVNKGTGKYSYYYKCKRKSPKHSSIHCSCLPLPAYGIEEYVVDFLKKLIRNPRDVYNHQLKLESRRLEKEMLNKRLSVLKRLINSHSRTIDSIKFQHKNGHLSDNQFTEQMDEEDKLYKKNKADYDELESRLADLTIDEGYNKVFELFKKKYLEELENLYKDREQLRDILQLIIHDIIVFSRPVTKKDIIAGRQKKGQMIPYKLNIRLRLPSEIMNDLERSFGVDEDKWWAI